MIKTFFIPRRSNTLEKKHHGDNFGCRGRCPDPAGLYIVCAERSAIYTQKCNRHAVGRFHEKDRDQKDDHVFLLNQVFQGQPTLFQGRLLHGRNLPKKCYCGQGKHTIHAELDGNSYPIIQHTNEGNGQNKAYGHEDPEASKICPFLNAQVIKGNTVGQGVNRRIEKGPDYDQNKNDHRRIHGHDHGIY